MKIETPPKSGNYLELYKYADDRLIVIIDSADSYGIVRNRISTLLTLPTRDTDIYNALIPFATLVTEEVTITNGSRVVDIYLAKDGDVYLFAEGQDSEGVKDQVTARFLRPGKGVIVPDLLQRLYLELLPYATR